MSRDIIKYGPAALAALIRELDEPVLFDAAALLAATEWRETLAANLATAGALCQAFADGYAAGYHAGDRPWPPSGDWHPNCDGEPAPGWAR